MTYIETRPEAIEAIHKSISHWNDICMGCCGDVTPGACALCRMYECGFDEPCPLVMAGKGCLDYEYFSPYGDYIDCFHHPSEKYYVCYVSAAEAAEAMLETLINLLPVEERQRYGG